ncbi:MAG: hypothetical protein DYG98_19125 [Haliscomenobacteraceae bacterium CHB4]|nr:hypothetical protein [Saprospiraceae bacterium]MCE7925172.1 hypothetical protein [Haliscomenobacteraceae bacterium CHB4]
MKLLELAMALAMPFQFVLAADPDVTVVPFGCVNKLAVVQAEADGKKGFFILDTGTPDLTLNDLYFQGETSEKTFYGVNAEALDVQMKFVRLNIEGFVKDTEAKIIDFTAIEAYMGLPILGAIGNKVFEDCEVVFDYVFREFTIYRLNKNGEPLQGRALHDPPRDTLSFEKKGCMPSVEMRVGEKNLRVGLDSGAGVNVLEENKKADIESCLKNGGKRSLASFGTDTLVASGAQLDSVRVRNIRCPALSVLFISLKQLNRDLPGPDLDGIMGYEFLSQYRTAINFRKKEIYIWDAAYVQEQLAAVQKQGKR